MYYLSTVLSLIYIFKRNTMRKHFYLLSFILILFACSKEDNTTPEPEPVQIPKYTVSITAGDGGTISSAGGTYDKDTQISITATPNAEYLFQAWSDGNTDNPRSIKVTADLTITANFVKKQYDLTVNVVGEGAVAEEVVIQGGRYNSGSQIKLTAAESEGWKFEGWSGALETTDNPITLSVDGEKEITATFIREKYDLNITIEGEGIVTEEVVVQPTQYDYETQVKLTATAEEYWEFIEWSGDIESTENPFIITIDSAKSLTAKFAKMDSDNDGVTDDVDQCPDTTEGTRVDVNGCTIPPIKVHSNGVTIIAEEWATIGTVYELNGREYRVVDLQMLEEMVENKEDVSIAVTTFITSFSFLFNNQFDFNDDISSWDTSNVTNMNRMFSTQFARDSVVFNQDISKWDTSNVELMGGMFSAAESFNQDISNWNVSKVKDMNFMFSRAKSFNQDLSAWDVSNVTECNYFAWQSGNLWTLPKPNFTNCTE